MSVRRDVNHGPAPMNATPAPPTEEATTCIPN